MKKRVLSAELGVLSKGEDSLLPETLRAIRHLVVDSALSTQHLMLRVHTGNVS